MDGWMDGWMDGRTALLASAQVASIPSRPALTTSIHTHIHYRLGLSNFFSAAEHIDSSLAVRSIALSPCTTL